MTKLLAVASHENWRENQNQVLHSCQNQEGKKISQN